MPVSQLTRTKGHEDCHYITPKCPRQRYSTIISRASSCSLNNSAEQQPQEKPTVPQCLRGRQTRPAWLEHTTLDHQQVILVPCVIRRGSCAATGVVCVHEGRGAVQIRTECVRGAFTEAIFPGRGMGLVALLWLCWRWVAVSNLLSAYYGFLPSSYWWEKLAKGYECSQVLYDGPWSSF